MALRYKVLEKFSQEAREYAASRVYDQENNPGRVCKHGGCVMHELLDFDGLAPMTYDPAISYIASLVGGLTEQEEEEVEKIVTLNDSGDLATPEAVRALLLGDTTPTGAAAAGVGA